MFDERYRKRLLQRKESGLLRNPPEIARRDGKYIFIGPERVLNFSSNDYLGLGVSEILRQKVSRNFMKYGTSSSASRLVSGNYDVISRAEEEYARYFGYEAALFFPSGYQANTGVMSTLFEKGDSLLFDKHIHASSIKGMVLSGASFQGYNHNSMAHLRRRLEGSPQEQSAVITESLFSMDGDFLDVQEFGAMKHDYGFLAVVDEAHAFGAVGEGGRGIARPVADVAVGTFGKALGLFGAFVLLPALWKEYLFNYSSPLIYSTTLPEAHAASALDILEVIAESDDARRNLKEVSRAMKDGLLAQGLTVKGDAHIVSWEVGDENRAAEISRELLARGIFVFPARYPTVPLGRAILRIGMTALNTEEDVKFFLAAVKQVRRKAAGNE
jgi:8-amino-7-oxononanoate synthase